MGFFSKKDDANTGEEPSTKSHNKGAVGQKVEVLAPVPGTAEQYRSVFLLVYSSATFKAHWALFAPLLEDKACKIGRRIHVTGSVRDGFKHEIQRSYDLRKTRTKPETPVEIGIVSTRHLVQVAQDFVHDVDTTARDAFEQLVLSVPAPNQTLNVASDNSAPRTGPVRRVKLSDC